jgi:hypothetical protein
MHGWIPGSKALEYKLHKEFDEYKVQGEWFYGVKPIRSFIEQEVIQSYDEPTLLKHDEPEDDEGLVDEY